MSKIDIPEFGKVETVAVLLFGSIAVYLLYRLWTAGDSIRAGISNTIGAVTDTVVGAVDAGKVAYDSAALAIAKNNVERNGPSQFPIYDKWDAAVQAPNDVAEPEPVFDPMTGVRIGMNDPTIIYGASVTIDSPDSSGLIGFHDPVQGVA